MIPVPVVITIYFSGGLARRGAESLVAQRRAHLP
jgi:hypothetical protein